MIRVSVCVSTILPRLTNFCLTFRWRSLLYKGGKFICWHFLLFQPSVVSDKINYSPYFGPDCKKTIKKNLQIYSQLSFKQYTYTVFINMNIIKIILQRSSEYETYLQDFSNPTAMTFRNKVFIVELSFCWFNANACPAAWNILDTRCMEKK